jgi:hypothetical protein
VSITYEVDQKRNVIFETWSGPVDAAELGAYWRAYLADPAVLRCRRTVVDLRKAVVVFKGHELSTLVKTIAEPVLAGRKWRTAVVVDEPHQFGVARQYSVFAEVYSSDEIFRTPEEALAWLIREEPG